jgi:hypothetical protein
LASGVLLASGSDVFGARHGQRKWNESSTGLDFRDRTEPIQAALRMSDDRRPPNPIARPENEPYDAKVRNRLPGGGGCDVARAVF